MFNVSIIDFRLQRVADFGKSQFWAMDRATMPPSNKNRSEVRGDRTNSKEKKKDKRGNWKTNDKGGKGYWNKLREVCRKDMKELLRSWQAKSEGEREA